MCMRTRRGYRYSCTDFVEIDSLNAVLELNNHLCETDKLSDGPKRVEASKKKKTRLKINVIERGPYCCFEKQTDNVHDGARYPFAAAPLFLLAIASTAIFTSPFAFVFA